MLPCSYASHQHVASTEGLAHTELTTLPRSQSRHQPATLAASIPTAAMHMQHSHAEHLTAVAVLHSQLHNMLQ